MSASSQPQLAYFGRQWQLSVVTASGTTLTLSNATQESLRVTFAIDTYMLMAYWNATITIFNMGAATGNQIQGAWQFNQALKTGDLVTVSGGYKLTASGAFNPNTNILYSGRILQSFWTRDNVVDYKLNLICVQGLFENTVNFASFPLTAGSTDHDALAQICSKCNIPLKADPTAQQVLSKTKYSRGQSFHGRPYGLISGIMDQYHGTTNPGAASSNGGVTLWPWMSQNGLNVRSFDPANPPTTPDYAYAPLNVGSVSPVNTNQGVVKYTLIGSPQQTQDGVIFRVLLDSAVKIGDVVQIAPGVLINLIAQQVGTLPSVTSRNGIYVVAGVRHVGDTRGSQDSWFTEIHGVILNFFANFITAYSPTQQSQASTQN